MNHNQRLILRLQRLERLAKSLIEMGKRENLSVGYQCEWDRRFNAIASELGMKDVY